MTIKRADKKWNDSEIRYLKRHHRELSAEELAMKLGRSGKSVRNRLYRLGLNFGGKKKVLVDWTKEEIEVLKKNPRMGIKRLKELLPRHTYLAIKMKRFKIKAFIKRVPSRKSDGYFVRYERYKGGRGVVFLHREVVEKSIGRRLEPTEQVHHIDLDKNNNMEENLYLCRDRTHHAKLHYNIEVIFAILYRKGIVRFNRKTGKYEISKEYVNSK